MALVESTRNGAFEEAIMSSASHIRVFVFFALFMIGSGSAHALSCFGQPRQVYVGDTASDASCTYNDIQTALNDEGSGCPVVVNITHEHTYTSQALTISG